jgi:class 3 adenylate cyclase
MLILAFIAILCMPLSMSVYLAWSFANMSRALQAQLDEVERLSVLARAQEEEKQRMLESRREELEAEVALRTEELRGQKQKSDDLLLNILPSEVAEELKERGQAAAKQYNDVTVLFTDFVDFTQRSEALTPAALVAEIDTCFRAFDEIIGRNGLEKIKTVGDAYIAVSGMPAANPDHAADVVRAGLEIRDFVEDRRRQHPESFGIRLGVHSGPVVAGIVGVKKFAYDIWGDAVNTAARMEQHSEPGQLNISETTYELVKGSFRCAYRGELEVKHKGRMHMYFVEGER